MSCSFLRFEHGEMIHENLIESFRSGEVENKSFSQSRSVLKIL